MANERRLIDANALKASFDERYDDAFMQSHTRPNIAWWEGYSSGVNWGRNTIADAPTVDAVEVIRCKGCKHFGGHGACNCHAADENGTPIFVREDDFCSYGERKDNEQT